MPLAAVTLDAAGTLFTPRVAVGITYARVAGAHGIVLDANVTGARFRAAMRVAPPLAFPDVAPPARRDQERAWWRAVVRDAFGIAGDHPAFDACFEALFAHFASPEAWALYPGACDALVAVRASGLKLAVVSNFDGRLGGLLAGLGVAPLLDAVVASAASGVAKPDPRLFRLAAELLGAPTTAVLHVGDDLESDVHGARAAGCHAMLLVHAEDIAVPPDVPILRSLRDLPSAIQRLRWRASEP